MTLTRLLTAETTPLDDHLAHLLKDPSGTPADRKVTLAVLAASAPWSTLYATLADTDPAVLAADPAFTDTFVLPAATTDAIIFVSTSGSDSNNGLSMGKAKLTIAAAIAALPAGAGVVQVLAGTFTLTVTLGAVSGLTLRGLGQATLIKIGNSANVAAIQINGDDNVTIESLAFDGNKANGNAQNLIYVLGSSVNTTLRNLTLINAGSSAIRLTGSATHVTIENVDLSGNVIGLELAACFDVKITDTHVTLSTIATTFQGGIYVTGATRVRFENVTSSGNLGHGWWIGGASVGIRLTNCEGNGNGTAGNDHRGFTTDGTAVVSMVNCEAKGNIEAGFFNTATTFVRYGACDAEGNNVGLRPGGHGFEVGPSQLDGCRSKGQLGDAANEGCGYFVSGPASLSNCDAELNYSAGIRIYEGSNNQVEGGIVKNNSQRGAGLHYGVQVGGVAASTDIQVIGVRAYDDQGTPTQEYGIAVNSAVDWYVLTGNNTRGNRTGGILDNGGANKVVANNLAA